LRRWQRHERPVGLPGWRARLARGFVRNIIATSLLVLVTAGLVVAYYLHPQPPRASPNGPTTLLGETGAPAWYRILTGQEATQTTLAPDGAWEVHTGSHCLIELVPSSGHDRFRFSALVRHQQAQFLSSAGIFVGHRAWPAGNRVLN